MHPRRRALSALLALVALVALSGGVSACGYSSDSKHTDEGEPLQLGELEYNVTFSRYLNRNDTEDTAYLEGQPEPPKENNYFGVFFEVQNKSDEPQQLPSSLTITDAEDNEYEVL